MLPISFDSAVIGTAADTGDDGKGFDAVRAKGVKMATLVSTSTPTVSRGAWAAIEAASPRISAHS